MNPRRIIPLAGIILINLLSLSLCNQMAVLAAPLSPDSLAARLMYQVWSFPQEKVYVMTDRDAYTSGDTVRFRAWLVDASTHARPQQPSRFVYVELRNPFGGVEKRVKIRAEEGRFAGIIALDEELTEGNYTLCAYTQFMQNSGKDYFFRKSLPVFSQLSRKYRLQTGTDDGMLRCSLFDRMSGQPVRAEHVAVMGADGNFLTQNIRKRSSYSMPISGRMAQSGVVKVKFDRYEKYVVIPYDTAAVSVSFHPEGGWLIPGEKNRIAFKSVDRRGLSSEIAGTIVDESGNAVTPIATTHRGMGSVEFTPLPGRRYCAVVDTMRFPLPEANPDAAVLRVYPLGADSIMVAVGGKWHEGLSLIAHTGGIVTMALRMESPELRLRRSELGSGIVQLLLADGSGNTLSSRMLFNHSGYVYNYSPDSLPPGDYAVREFRDLRPDSTTSIVSNLLLQSELKGHIEDPDYYFRRRDSIAGANLDLLLLTQGWQRYDVPASLRGIFTEPGTPLELGGSITGTVRSRWRGKPLEDAIVMLLAPRMEHAAQAITDSDGRFVFEGFDWPEDTSFIIQVFGKSGSKEHNYDVDNDVFPLSDALASRADESVPANLIDESILTAGTIMLEELEVTAPMTLEESRREMLSALGVRSFTSKDIDEMRATTYEEVLRKIPGIRVFNGNVMSMISRNAYNSGYGGSPVEFWVDGIQWISASSFNSGSFSTAHSSAAELIGGEMSSEHSLSTSMYNTLTEFSDMYPIHIMKSIEYFRPSAAMIISLSAADRGGALVFTTKDASEIKEWDSGLFLQNFQLLGYQNQPDSYRPHYIYDPTGDDTIFNAAWIPCADSKEEIPRQQDTFIQIEGITDGFIPVLIRQSPATSDSTSTTSNNTCQPRAFSTNGRLRATPPCAS